MALAPAAFAAPLGAAPPSRWWKGNLHTHTFWSDGDDFPEMVVEWYKTNGYHFLALSDHNVLTEGQKWRSFTNGHKDETAFRKYLQRFGPRWVDVRTETNLTQVRLKQLKEFRRLFEEPGRFLLVPAEEITENFRSRPIHLNATNLRRLIKPRGGDTVLEVLQNNVDAVWSQRRRTRQPMFPHVNHPNFGWALTAEDIAFVRGERFFEVYNGHPLVHNEGDDQHASTDRIWDIILTRRLAELRGEVIFGLAVDDAHNYHVQGVGRSNAGRGWIMVRASSLVPSTLIAALEAGDFYATSGVQLSEVRREPNKLSLAIAPEAGVTYQTQFIGTRRGYDPSSEPVTDKSGNLLRTTRRYSPSIGQVLAEVPGLAPTYTLKGDEIYVRAKVISSKPKSNPYKAGEFEIAWTQPLVPSP
jgi:hypothetical protein